jgi:hypothetical protein
MTRSRSRADVWRDLSPTVKSMIPRRLKANLRAAALRHGFIETPVFRYPFLGLTEGSPYPQYMWGTLCAAAVAARLGYDRISVIEFGVAGGNGLVALEHCAQQATKLSGVAIDVYGFDTGVGLPKPVDHRDLPQLWREGFFTMDVEQLQARLSSAQLLLGAVSDTVGDFVASNPAPIGFVSFDLDMYSSTVDAFQAFEGSLDILMPRVVCYFDDLIGFSHGDFSGERLAITEFNERHESRKLSKIYGLRYVMSLEQWWTDQMYMAHFFEHPRYNDYDGSNQVRSLPLAGSQ